MVAGNVPTLGEMIAGTDRIQMSFIVLNKWHDDWLVVVLQAIIGNSQFHVHYKFTCIFIYENLDIIYRVMVLYRLSKTCYCDFFVVLHHPFSYYVTLFRITSQFFRITSSFWYYFHTFSVLHHPFVIIFTLLVVLLHLFGIISTLLAVLPHSFAITSSFTDSFDLPFIALLLT